MKKNVLIIIAAQYPIVSIFIPSPLDSQALQPFTFQKKV